MPRTTLKIATPIIIAGGGAAGLMAAGQAAEAGCSVLILEKMKQPGRKISISGKGRCNLTNTADLTDFLNHFSKSGKFLRQSFHHFFSHDLIDFLEGHHLPVVTERGGRVFPASGNAREVVQVLQQWLEDCGGIVRTSCPVERIVVDRSSITGVVAKGKKIPCNQLIITTGGASYPATGSTGDGYALAEQAGHSIVPIQPALVPLVTKGSIAGRMAGLQLRNINLRCYINGRKKRELFGELQFMPYGLSGPVVLTMSSQVVAALDKGEEVVLAIDLKPALDEQKLDARLQRDFTSRHKEPLESVLRGLLPREMVKVALELNELPPDRQAGTVRAAERKRLRSWLKNFRFQVSSHRPIKEAIVTSGGVDTREVDPRTMESKLTRGLYFAGEVLDLQADTGGYNLQAAFSTGWLAGRSAAEAWGCG